MHSLPTLDAASAAQVHGAFSDLICADPDLTQAEFDAIIEANWGCAEPPASAEDRNNADVPLPRSWVGPGTPERTRQANDGQPPTSDLDRLRSPPGRNSLTAALT